MPFLYDKPSVRTETYTYRAAGLLLPVPEDTPIDIVFENGKFKRCSLLENGRNEREYWRLLGEIDRKISELEHRYAGEPAPLSEAFAAALARAELRYAPSDSEDA